MIATVYRFIWALGFWSLICSNAFGQAATEAPLISGEFNGVSFQQFVREIESKTPYHFYYNARQTDSLIIRISIQNKPLKAVLQELFRGKDFFFSIDSQNRVFVSGGRAIQTDLPISFFEGADEPEGDNTQVLEEFMRREETEKKSISAENKLYEIGPKTAEIKSGNANLAGHIRNMASGEPVIGAVIYIENPRIGVSTDQFGFYSITLPRGRHELKIRSVGMKDTKRLIVLYGDGKLDLEMMDDVIPLREVVIESEKDRNVSSLQMGVERLDIKTIKQVPTVFGESDILKVVLTLPGVKSVGESSTGLNVRGGATDQNLILFNDATVYNSSHLFGFFSAFNPDVVQNVELYKSGIPSRYGGRLSSVLDVTTRDGNKKKFAGSGGIGLITGRLTLEGPIIKDKTSFLIGGRSTYSDWLLRRIPNKQFNRSRASFYDLNLHLSHEFNDKSSLFLTGYYSKDKFRLNSDTLFGYSNQNTSIKWKYIFNNKLYSVLTGSFSRYEYSITSENNEVNAFRHSFDINQSQFKADFNYFPTSKHTIDFGLSSVFYTLFPGSFVPRGAESKVIPNVVEAEQALESALYVGDKFDISPRFSLQFGLRYSLYQFLGPKKIYQYAPGISREEGSIQDSLSYSGGKVINSYHGPEYRLSARFVLTQNSSVKVSYNKMRQYIHMLSNTTAISPTDIWKLSDPHIRPQVGDQYSVGYYHNFKNNTIETSIEGYYKDIQNYLDYKSGAELFLNHAIERDVINTIGKAYGVELMVKKLTGRVNGWVSYTYSRTMLQMQDPLSTEQINFGEYYPSNYDKPHDFTLISNYRVNKRFSFSFNFTYSTGRPITLPLGKFELAGSKRVYYGPRNQARIPDYYRADFSMNIEGNHKISKLAHSSWTIAVYNLTGRKNPYSVYFKSENGVIRGYKLSIFGQPIPTVTYNFKF